MKIAAVTPKIHLGDCEYNADRIIEYAKQGFERGCELVVFPSGVITGNTCGDYAENADLKMSEEKALCRIEENTGSLTDVAIAVGTHLCGSGIVLIKDGGRKVLEVGEVAEICERKVAFGGKLSDLRDSKADVGIYMCALEQYAGSREEYFAALKESSQNKKIICVSAGPGESTDECIYSGLKAFAAGEEIIDYSTKEGLIVFDTEDTTAPLRTNSYDADPPGFLPADEDLRDGFCLDILNIQAKALAGRLEFLHTDKCILGLSGGLDSTLALVAAVNAFERAGLDKKGIICVTMPGFGTGSASKNNAYRLAEVFGVTLREIDIKEQTTLHLKSIGQPEEGGEFVSDVTFENAQARVRTMILMDIANMENSIVIGTGDMSELALGWCTYNGDHMSMYSVNAGVPKTAIAPTLKIYADRVADPADRDELNEIFNDIINAPVSPELLPTDDNGQVIQKTEDSLGPYELHDFFLYLFLKGGYTFKEIYEKAVEKYKGIYDEALIKKTLQIFIRRFFANQFKRSCMPVGAKVLKYSLSPRSGFRMASDMYVGWLAGQL